MIVYDFDKTVFRRESSFLFFRYCVRKHPGLLKHLPRMGWFALLAKLKRCTLTRFKEEFHRYLSSLSDTEELLRSFWDRYERCIPAWLPPLLPRGGLVISASPEFLVEGLCSRLGLRVMGTRMDIRSGAITGHNCRGEEKTRRFRREYPDAEVEAFYSDSLADSPMAALAKKAWLVKGDRLSPWPGKNEDKQA
jgi:phosphoserine phosphatase